MVGRQDQTYPIVEDIICYFLPIVPYYIGFNHPGATYRALGHNVTAMSLSYKRSGRR
jgi:hypothetical protein